MELTDASGARIGWQYVNRNEETELYNTSGKLVSVTSRTGVTQTLSYSDATTPVNIAPIPGLLIRIVDTFGRQIAFSYNDARRISTMTDPIGGLYQYAYSTSGNLSTVTFPDGRVRTYIYNEPTHTQNTHLPFALTGIIDESNRRFGTYAYDSSGRAISTEHAGGAKKFSIRYNKNNTSSVTDALGTMRTYNFAHVVGSAKWGGSTQPNRSSGLSTTVTTYDANGNVSTRTDFNGAVTKYSYDLTRNLETGRTEGFDTSQARTITTAWHPTYRLPLKIAEPLRITINSYDANGNLLSKTVQATSDATGSQSLSAPVVGIARTWRYTYNEFGQVLTATGPRTDVNDTTTYTYDGMGNLTTVTNAADHITTLSNYDANGRVGRIVDANGMTTDMTYSRRGWLTSRTVSGNGSTEVTGYDYDGVGQLKKVTLPDSSWIGYDYDAAHRLTDTYDSTGNRISYTLDAMGNRLKEQVTDPSGALAKQTTRLYDALNRLQEVTGAGQ
ncbi:MAG: hypothetical protein A3I66_13435 [Burkholderiales bacterium RIFCSPLOWO2_02_FULL_57_36]|nr:MAG: hypothetical protein A3I66_13435 [Burkholderiales bacterium RIFCSPLOWO2_02_FULL_57_36]